MLTIFFTFSWTIASILVGVQVEGAKPSTFEEAIENADDDSRALQMWLENLTSK